MSASIASTGGCRTISWFLVALFACAGTPLEVPAQMAPQASPSLARVMVLGVAHFVARRDIHNSAFEDDPLSPNRQKQIYQVVERLARFHPTKVLIEAPMGSPLYEQRYREYLAGTFQLGADETYQFGFRLARMAGNPAIYPIDTFGPDLLNDNPRIDAYLKDHFSTVRDPRFDAFLARQTELERFGTYLDLLRYLNSDDAIRANASFYSLLDGMGRDADDAGASYVSQWYARNAYIFSNVSSVVQAGDRAVIVMGQGHEYLLREFVRLNPNYLDVDPLRYLGR